MSPTLLNFLIRLLVITTIVFIGHLFVLNFLDYPFLNDNIVLSYSINIVSAIIIFLLLFVLRHKFKNQLGFIFLFGSVIKFGLFLLVLYRPFYSDGIISKSEFFAFFIPYFFTHTIEIFSLSKWLNKIE
jgi:hypothetical protein